MANIVRDLGDTSSYWAAIWTMCPMQDVHVICDAPIGCFNLVATAIPDYTDAIPHIENVTPSVITEAEVGGSGTGPAVERTYRDLRDEGLLADKQLIVVSTAESEMIGSDLSDLVTKLQPGTTFFHSESLTEDEWTGRDRVLQWLWETYGAQAAAGITPEPGLVNIIGPTYGCFNSYSDLHEIKRLIEGAGGRINMVYPFESSLAETPQLARASLNVVLYKEFGHTLATTLHTSFGAAWLHAPLGMHQTTEFIRALGEHLGTQEQAAAFIEQEKRTTLQAVWDLWRGPQGDWFSTTSIGIVAARTYAEGLADYLGNELGMPIAFSVGHPLRPGDLDNDGVRQILHSKAPSFVFGSINEKIYLSESGSRMSTFIPAAFPLPIVRRSVGTPFMGYRGTVHIIQEIMNFLYDTLYNFLPLDSAYKQKAQGPPMGPPSAPSGPPSQASGNGQNGGQTAPAGASPGNLPWDPDAKDVLDAALEKLPFMARISASRELQMQVEAVARERGLSHVTADLAAEVLDT